MGFKPILDKVIALIRMNVPGQLGCLKCPRLVQFSCEAEGVLGYL